MGNLDRVIRLLLVAIAYMLVYTGVVTGALKIILGLVGFVLVVTALFGVCPLYSLFGIDTCASKNIKSR